MVRHIRWACFLALVISSLLPGPARAQQRAKEDVTLRGRILRPDGSPLANTPLYVDAVDSGFFGGTKRYSGATDGAGNYSFFFEDAKYQGEQTDTDYYLHVKMRSAVNGSQEVEAEYELELLEPVHNAPDMVLWDPAASVQTFERDLHLSYPPRQSSTNGADTYIGNTRIISSRTSTLIDRRDIEDAAVLLVPRATDDVGAEGTIYHQRFSAARLPAKGTLVPLSRNASCVAKFSDGRTTPCPELTDGDLTTAEGSETFARELLIDLGAVKPVGEVRTRGSCFCTVTVSADGSNWASDPGSSTPVGARFVRITGSFVDSVNHVSVWPTSWNRRTSASVTPTPAPAQPSRPIPSRAPAAPRAQAPLPTTPLVTSPPETAPLATTPPQPVTTAGRSALPLAKDSRGPHASGLLRVVGVMSLAGAAFVLGQRIQRFDAVLKNR